MGCSIIFLWLINVLHCKHYLVEVDADDQDGHRLAERRGVTEAAEEDEIDVEDINEITDDETEDGTDYQGTRPCSCPKKKPRRICQLRCCHTCLYKRSTKKMQLRCLHVKGLNLRDCITYKPYW